MTAAQATILRTLGTTEAYGLELARLCGISRGGIYVLLGRLRHKGFVESREQAGGQGKRGPPRVLYRRTETGGRALELWDELLVLEGKT